MSLIFWARFISKLEDEHYTQEFEKDQHIWYGSASWFEISNIPMNEIFF